MKFYCVTIRMKPPHQYFLNSDLLCLLKCS